MQAQCPRIFVIDDDDDDVRASVCLLVRSFGWEARGFAPAEQFLEILQCGQLNCLVFDLNLPGMPGSQLQETLAQRGVKIPVVVITADSKSPLATRATAAGTVAGLAKPLLDDDLKMSVERAIAA